MTKIYGIQDDKGRLISVDTSFMMLYEDWRMDKYNGTIVEIETEPHTVLSPEQINEKLEKIYGDKK